VQESERTSVISLCQQIHQHLQAVSEDFHRELGRTNYVSPTSYLDLLSMYKKLLVTKLSENRQLASRYTVGLQKLHDCEQQVAVMQAELTALQPLLVRSVAEAETLIARIAREKCDVVQPKAKACCPSASSLLFVSRSSLVYTSQCSKLR
jgi:dynein heavy chain, axonemal